MELLVVSPVNWDRGAIREFCRGEGWTIHEASNWSSAKDLLASESPSLVVCAENLRDAGWQSVADGLDAHYAPLSLIVLAQGPGGDLLPEVVHRGGYDVLAAPLEREHTLRTLALAWNAARNKFLNGAPARLKRRETPPANPRGARSAATAA
jgi:DNA-binding NtrC family response regulator